MDLPQALKRFRQEYGLTQKQVSNAVGVNIRLYQKYEAGEVEPAVSVVSAISDVFHVSTDYLLGRTDNPKLHVFEEAPKLTDRDFIDKLIFFTHLDHKERLREAADAGIEIKDPAVEYADLLLRRYHRDLLAHLIEAGVKL